MERLTSMLTITNRNCLVYCLLALLTIILLGCGSAVTTTTEVVYRDPVRVTVIPLPDEGECVQVASDTWVENEGEHADVYANPDCNHYSENGVICNNLEVGEACAVGLTIYTIQGEERQMILNQIEIL